MDDMSLIYNINLCRICQIPDNLDLVNTSTTADNGETYLDCLKFIFNDILWIEDHEISVACKICLEKIEDIIEFKRICLESNTRRANLNLNDVKIEIEAVKVESNDQKTNVNIENGQIQQIEAASSVLRKKRKGMQRGNALKPKKLRVSKNEIKVKNKKCRKKAIKEDSLSDIAESDEDVVMNDVEKEKNDIEDQNDSFPQTNGTLSKEMTCRICKKKFPNYKILKKHSKKVHPKHLFYHCDVCEETFTKKDFLERHEFKHNGVKKYVCSFCGAKYITLSDLKHHMDNHKDYAKYACAICPSKVFKTSNCLTKHKMVVHRDHKDYKHFCTECGMRFGMLSGLKIHLLRHANIRKFSCHLCEKMFFTKHDLDRHGETHSNVRPFKCDLCSAEFKRKSVLVKHKAKVHGIGNYKHPVPKFTCTYCSKAILTKDKLVRHIRTHTGVKPFKCRLCSTKFSCNSYVKGHVKGKHNVDVEASDFNVKSYYDVCEAEDSVPENDSSGLFLNTEEKGKGII